MREKRRLTRFDDGGAPSGTREMLNGSGGQRKDNDVKSQIHTRTHEHTVDEENLLI